MAGFAHVFAGPDHLAAVAPLAIDQKQKPLSAGLFWGIGHSSGVWILALAAILLRDALPLDWLSSWSERIVGVVLIAVGLWAIRKALSVKVHSHIHEHDGVAHAHIHVHEEGLKQHDHIDHAHKHRAMGIGMLHGFAGTSHLLGVIPALMLPSRLSAVLYVIAFGVGSIGGMSIFTWMVGRLAGRFNGSGQRATQCLFYGSGLTAIVVGCFWLAM
ncbi:MAG: hydantoin utilization protein A [Phycisphaerae bacterium]|nr:MAG: hydantoin utilization protein A [Phycisphaerae bacterium]